MSAATVADLLEAAAARLGAAGVPKPRREANRLWAWQNRVNPGDSYLGRDRTALAGRAREFELAIDRRVRGEPLAYVLGHTGFRRLEIRCDRRALIPRPETEGVVELALARRRTGRALDLGTGTGCLALALADEGHFSSIVAVDCCGAALGLAAENVAATGLRVELLRSDLRGALRGRQFDLLVTNPPYLTAAEFESLDPSVGQWEPRQALVGGIAGMELVSRILGESPGLLAPGGWLIMEVDSHRSGAAAGLARTVGWENVGIEKDLFGRERYLTAQPGHHRGGGV